MAWTRALCMLPVATKVRGAGLADGARIGVTAGSKEELADAVAVLGTVRDGEVAPEPVAVEEHPARPTTATNADTARPNHLAAVTRPTLPIDRNSLVDLREVGMSSLSKVFVERTHRARLNHGPSYA